MGRLFILSIAVYLFVSSLTGRARAAEARPGTSAAVSASLFPSPETAPEDRAEPEEPDFAFVAGGPYTQKKNSIQFILPGQIGRRRSTLGGTVLEHQEFGTFLRTEWGITDRLELDAILPAGGARDRQDGSTVNSDFAFSDAVLGLRYRLSRESSAPLTLTLGPQLIIPSGSFARGTGFERAGYALDMAAAKEWRGPLFFYTSFNYTVFPAVRDLLAASPRTFNVHNVFFGSALGLRPLEKNRGTSHHDLHLFLEYGLGREQDLDKKGNETVKVSEVRTVFAPGARYGFLTRSRRLFEIGVSFPVGLNSATPRRGIILQIQFEQFFRYRPN